MTLDPTSDMRQRLKSLGIKQIALARRLGVRPATINDALKGRTARDTRLQAEIEALEIMTAEQRTTWLAGGH
jgi:transcriptional regulator with XRE-family HTH domain